jgi:hypothetical protein
MSVPGAAALFTAGGGTRVIAMSDQCSLAFAWDQR